MAIAYLCLGSNKGDRIGYIQQAASLLNTNDLSSLLLDAYAKFMPKQTIAQHSNDSIVKYSFFLIKISFK